MKEIIIKQNDANKRIDNFIKKYLNNAPLSFIYKLFRKKDVKVNGKPVKIDYITKLDDKITIYVKDEQLDDFKTDNRTYSTKQNFKVIYEDQNVLVINKENNIAVQPGDDQSSDDISKQVIGYLIKNGSYKIEDENTFVPSPAHRIDRNTSGILIIGKNLMALQELFRAFKDHEGIIKKYLALASGVISDEIDIEAPLYKNEKTKIVTVDYKNGIEAKTHLKPIKKNANSTLVEVQIYTGRTHQIRVHLKHISHPLIGDHKYGNENSDSLAKKYKMKSYFLHAKSICFKNLTGEMAYLNDMVFTAPLFKWQEELLERI